MRRPSLLVAAVAAIGLAGSVRTVVGQQLPAPRDTVWWYVTSYQLEWPRVDSLYKLTRAYTLPAAAEARKMGTLLDYRMLIHAYGSEYNVQVMRAYRRFGLAPL